MSSVAARGSLQGGRAHRVRKSSNQHSSYWASLMEETSVVSLFWMWDLWAEVSLGGTVPRKLRQRINALATGTTVPCHLPLISSEGLTPHLRSPYSAVHTLGQLILNTIIWPWKQRSNDTPLGWVPSPPTHSRISTDYSSGIPIENDKYSCRGALVHKIRYQKSEFTEIHFILNRK